MREQVYNLQSAANSSASEQPVLSEDIWASS